MECTDNGIGAPIEKINLKNGLLNVENRNHSIKGNLTFDTLNRKGFKNKYLLSNIKILICSKIVFILVEVANCVFRY